LRKAPGYAAGTEVFNHYRRAAQQRGLSFTLTRPEFDALTQQSCHYCGAPPGNTHARKHYNGAFVYSGIDRKDSGGGYQPDNCLPSCSACNVMKQDLPYESFLAHVHRICSRHNAPVSPVASYRMAFGCGGNFRPPNFEADDSQEALTEPEAEETDRG
jgi:hypothetical protein